MIRKVRVTLDVEYDDSSYTHPSEWNWTELMDLGDGESATLVECEDTDEHEYAG